MAKILIAEDERDIRDLIEFTLTYAGHQVFKAANGAEAVELAPKVLPDLIMMDVRMPRMTGYEACRQMKTMDTVKDIPVVFLSAKGQESEIDTGLDAGAYDYILKPFEPFTLVNRVAEILAKFQAEKAAAAAKPQPAPAVDGVTNGVTNSAPSPASSTSEKQPSEVKSGE
jgi:DNA-binding response OmpR family regulator